MNKDVIYIDVEDDITAIIGKVKDAKEKIVALVPPKRIGVLQSAVNLQLLARAATQADKRLVLITSNSALSALAAAAQVPVAKNLQSKPEIAEISALDVDNGEDVIDGSQLPVGELAKTADSGAPELAIFGGASEAATNDNALAEAPRAVPPAPGQLPKKPKAKSGIKVPNFNKFRKRLILAIGGGVLLVAFLIWAVFFAPRATVIITARTTDSSTDAKISLSPSLATSASAATMKIITQQTKKDSSIDFTPTGSKDVGTKATGEMKITRTSISSNPLNVPAGTSFSSGNLTFVSTEGTTLSGTSIGPGGIQQDSATVSVQATNVGDEYNLSARPYESSVGGISAQGTDMSGGSKRTVTVVSADDIQKATDQLAQQNSDDMKTQLKKQFNSDFDVIDQSFKIDRGTPASSPAQDQEVSDGAKAKLTVTVTYSLSGVTKADVGHYLDDYFQGQLTDKNQQRVYDNGAGAVTFTNVSSTDNGFTANIVATAKVGPKINDDDIKNAAKGKRYGEIQSAIETIQGVDNVDVKFWPFWVSKAPNNTDKIKVDFNLNDSK